MTEGAAVAVWYREDTELNQRVAALVERDLAALGHQVLKDATLILDLDSLVVRDGGRDPAVGVSGQGSSRSRSSLELSIEIPLGKDGRSKLSPYVQVNLRLAERGRTPIWEAAAVGELAGRDRFVVADELARALMTGFGHTIERKSL